MAAPERCDNTNHPKLTPQGKSDCRKYCRSCWPEDGTSKRRARFYRNPGKFSLHVSSGIRLVSSYMARLNLAMPSYVSPEVAGPAARRGVNMVRLDDGTFRPSCHRSGYASTACSPMSAPSTKVNLRFARSQAGPARCCPRQSARSRTSDATFQARVREQLQRFGGYRSGRKPARRISTASCGLIKRRGLAGLNFLRQFRFWEVASPTNMGLGKDRTGLGVARSSPGAGAKRRAHTLHGRQSPADRIGPSLVVNGRNL